MKIINWGAALLCVVLLCFSVASIITEEKQINFNEFKLENKSISKESEKIEGKINKIYEYFHKNNYKLKDTTFILTSFMKIGDKSDKIFLNPETLTDFNLMQLILLKEFSHYVNYGLMYGLISDIAQECDMDVGTIERFSIEEIKNNCGNFSLDYISFFPKIASEREISMSKFISVELANHIMDKHGKEYYFDLMKKSVDVLLVDEIHKEFLEWMRSIGGEITPAQMSIGTLFSQESNNDVLKFQKHNVKWEIYLKNQERYNEMFPNIYKDTKTFNQYMNVFYDEIDRLERVFGCESEKLPVICVKIYANKTENLGLFRDGTDTIEINSIASFSHEYVHFVDSFLKKKGKYGCIGEMRAVYYSVDFPLSKKIIQKRIDYIKPLFQEMKKKGEIKFDPIEAVEHHIKREMKPDDYYVYYNDLAIYLAISSGEELPSLFNVSGEGYPTDCWISLVRYIIRNYGEAALDTIMIQEQLPDGTFKNISQVIEEWKVYVTNLVDFDYEIKGGVENEV